MTNLSTIKSKEKLMEELNKRAKIIRDYYGFETPFQVQQFNNCHEEMKKLESQLSYHLSRLNKKEVAQ